MPANVTSLPDKAPRFVDPRTSPAEQMAQLKALIDQPPENSRIVTYTPQLCQLILGTGPEDQGLNLGAGHGNRSLRPSKIKRFAEAMKDGAWNLTGDTIKFSSLGHLLDGQNRLKAATVAKKAFKSHTVFGIKPEAFAVVDTGAGRTGPDTLHIQGVPNPTVTAQAVRWVMLCGDMPKGEQPERGRKIENKDLLEHYLEEIDVDVMESAIEDAKEVRRHSEGHIPTGAVAGLLYLFDKKSHTARVKFAESLQGKRVGKVLVGKIRVVKKGAGGRINELQVIAWIIEAWNAHRAGSKLTASMLKWNTDRETFPSIS